MMVDAYTSKWLAFMCFRQGVPFNAQAVFTAEDAAAVTPEDIVRFLNMKAYKKEAPGPDDRPTHARASTLEFYKKAISAFMPRRMAVWDDVRREGNPTRSTQVNDLIKAVRKAEEARRGVEVTEPSGGAVMRELVRMNAQLNNMKRRLEEINAGVTSEMLHLRSDVNHKLELMHSSLKRIAPRPAMTTRGHVPPITTRRHVPPITTRGHVPPIPTRGHVPPTASSSSSHLAKLPKCPRDLYTLWQEYVFGRDGVKPAKQFTACERGNDKSAYCPLRIAGLEVRHLYETNRARLRVFALLFVLSHALRTRWFRRWLLRLHFRLTAETPQLVYQATPENTRLLMRCPTMTQEKYYPPWRLFNGHLQTLRLAQEEQYQHPIVHYERQIMDMPDGGIVSLDWALPPRDDGTIPRVSELDRSRRTMLLLPGLTGGSGEFYIRCVVHRMLELGWQCVVLNARGCADTPLKTAHLFCCAYTDDLRFAVSQLHSAYGFSEAFVVVGFSMGSNVLVKYLGEEGERVRGVVTAGISVGNPFDLVACASNLSSTLFYRKTYDAALNRNLQELFFRKSNAHQVFRHDDRVDLDSLRQARHLFEFDDRLTRVVFGYDSVHHYYTDASSARRLGDVRVPLLCLNAKDDPISVQTAIPFEAPHANANVVLCVTNRGGHLAFYEGDRGDDDVQETAKRHAVDDNGVSVWSVRVISEFAESARATRRQAA
ncbi:hypothetical protein ATCC90586_000012 [Pythium insidiosum]|nr:hypothetical protein ATCC90586_000012 [Pythium insidiosum]